MLLATTKFTVGNNLDFWLYDGNCSLTVSQECRGHFSLAQTCWGHRCLTGAFLKAEWLDIRESKTIFMACIAYKIPYIGSCVSILDCQEDILMTCGSCG